MLHIVRFFQNIFRGDPEAIAAAQAAHAANKRRGRPPSMKGDSFSPERKILVSLKSHLKPLGTPEKVRKKIDRFNGMSEEEVSKRTLPDLITHNLDILIVSYLHLVFW